MCDGAGGGDGPVVHESNGIFQFSEDFFGQEDKVEGKKMAVPYLFEPTEHYWWRRGHVDDDVVISRISYSFVTRNYGVVLETCLKYIFSIGDNSDLSGFYLPNGQGSIGDYVHKMMPGLSLSPKTPTIRNVLPFVVETCRILGYRDMAYSWIVITEKLLQIRDPGLCLMFSAVYHHFGDSDSKSLLCLRLFICHVEMEAAKKDFLALRHNGQEPSENPKLYK